MAENETATVTILHQPRPKTAAERGRAFRQRQREKSTVNSGKIAVKSAQPVEKPKTFANGDPTFAELERTTAELQASCKRGIEAARALRNAVASRSLWKRVS